MRLKPLFLMSGCLLAGAVTPVHAVDDRVLADIQSRVGAVEAKKDARG